MEDVKLAVWGFEQGFLPYAGGLFDQPKTLLYDMIEWLNARESIRKENGVTGSDTQVQSKDGYAKIDL